ncbi:hypothetical protein C0992_006563 [Termitomyces sp. T32_za158]|nr:hypothetical protein C0992_006563 [Termitomyces sp. T32_za158]
MHQRGIHDSFHASLLQIHHPNDDRLFPGRLYEQIAEPDQHPTEWAADKVLRHAGSKENALFEVLWKSGDKTWLLKPQVEDLNLLQPYLDALGVESAADLPAGSGTPPPHDPQIFLGSQNFCRSGGIKTQKDDHDTHPLAIASVHINSTQPHHNTHPPPAPPAMRRRNKTFSQPAKGTEGDPDQQSCQQRPASHYTVPNTLDLKRDDGMISLKYPGETMPCYVFSPRQFQAYREWDGHCRRDSYYWHGHSIPSGYGDVADAFNSHPTYPCKLVAWDPERKGYFSPFYSIPESALVVSSIDPRYKPFSDVGIIQPNGDVDEQRWKVVLSALMRPHFQAERNRERGEEKKRMHRAEVARQAEVIPAGQLAPPRLHKRARTNDALSAGDAPLISLSVRQSPHRHTPRDNRAALIAPPKEPATAGDGSRKPEVLSGRPAGGTPPLAPAGGSPIDPVPSARKEIPEPQDQEMYDPDKDPELSTSPA